MKLNSRSPGRALLLVVATGLSACGAPEHPDPPVASTTPPVPPAPSSSSTTPPAASAAPTAPPVPTAITPALATMPADAVGVPGQETFDLFSWLSFIAANWPADPATCGPNVQKSILDGTGPVAWELYSQDSDVFVPKGSKPAAWCSQGASAVKGAQIARVPASARKLAEKTGVTRFFAQHTKARHGTVVDAQGVDEAVDGVLTDQNGRFVRYEVRLNGDEYNYLLASNLWNASGQKGATIQFPNGPKAMCGAAPCGPTGAMEIKAAWKVLGKGDDWKTFYQIKAIVFNDDQDPPTPSPGENPVTLGLVGLHIIHKTERQPKWVWSTFEHVKNTSQSFNNAKCPETPPYTASAPTPCTGACCPPNTQTAATFKDAKGNPYYKELDAKGTPINKPVQVTRVAPIEDPTLGLNADFKKLLGTSVWANYELVSTVWSGEFGSLPKPPFLANATMETFNQGPVPPTDGPNPYPSPKYQPFSTAVSASCLKCHSVATDTAKAPADFSFLLSNAQ